MCQDCKTRYLLLLWAWTHLSVSCKWTLGHGSPSHGAPGGRSCSSRRPRTASETRRRELWRRADNSPALFSPASGGASPSACAVGRSEAGPWWFLRVSSSIWQRSPWTSACPAAPRSPGQTSCTCNIPRQCPARSHWAHDCGPSRVGCFDF